MTRKPLLVYLGLQFLTLNACMALAACFYDSLPAYVNTTLLIFLLPFVSGIVVGKVAGRMTGDEKTEESLTAANVLIGILAAVAVGVFVHNGGREAVRSLFLRVVACTPSEAVEQDDADCFAFEGVTVLEALSRAHTTRRTTHHGPQDQSHRNSTLHDTDTYSVAPLVSEDSGQKGAIAVWACANTSVTRNGEDELVSERARGALAAPEDAAVLFGETIRDPLLLKSYRTAADLVLERPELAQADGALFVHITPDFHALRRTRITTGIIILGIANALLVLLPTAIFPFALRKKDEDEA